MKYFCNGCRTEINLKNDRVPGKYVYTCSCCNKPMKKCDMVTEAQIKRSKEDPLRPTTIPEFHYCSSCDSYVRLDEMDNYGRCEKCVEEYGDIE